MRDHHGHNHRHGASTGLFWALGLTLGFAGVEAVSGWWSGSLALLSDSGHMLTDSMSLGLAAGAAMLAKRAPSRLHTFGLGRAEILAAFINALAMIVIVVWISVEAVERFSQPGQIKGGVVLAVASIGLLINLGAAWILSGDRQNLNVRAALLHVIGDLLGSVAALVSGAVILLTGWTTIDPLLSLFIVALILVSAVRVLREALHALMEGVPLHLDLESVGRSMAAVDGVVSVHDLHIWSLSSSHIALAAHIVIRDFQAWPATMEHVQKRLMSEFGIHHVTLQPERDEQFVDASRIVKEAYTSQKKP